MEEPKVYVINVYNKYCADKVIMTFQVHGIYYAIIETTLEWGKPILQSVEEDNTNFYIYNSLDEAKEYVRKLKRFEGMRY